MIPKEKKLTENNVSKWDSWYKNLPEKPSSFNYGDTITYELAAEFLKDCDTVEDWGCGAGGFLRFRPDAIGVDGSDTKFATKKNINLKTYTSKCDGVHIRHILEHNYNWESILRNALTSAVRKVVITLFIPLTEVDTVEVSYNAEYGVDVPDIAICKKEFMDIIASFNPSNVSSECLKTSTSYGEEQIFYITIQ